MKMLPLLLPLLLVPFACQPAEVVEPDQDAEVEVASEILPTPFTAEQIRGSCPPGTQVVYRIQLTDQPPMLQFMLFRDGDEVNATIESWAESGRGEPLGPRGTSVTPWTELRDHALLAAGSTRAQEKFTTEQGELEGWHYSEPVDDERGKGTREFWFDQRFPGPPALLVETVGGMETMRMEMIGRTLP
jgi:hypothetical protein